MDGAFYGAAISGVPTFSTSTLANTLAASLDWKRIERRGRRNRASLDEIMADPITHLLMRADGVCPEDVVGMVRHLRNSIAIP